MTTSLLVKNKKIYELLLAVISAFGLLYYITEVISNNEILGSVITLPVVIAYYFVWKHIFEGEKFTKPGAITGILFTYIFSVCLSLGYQLELFDPIVRFKKALLEGLLFGLAFFPVILILISIFSCLSDRKITKAVRSDKRKKHILLFVIVCVVWFCVWLAIWPGMFGYDGTYWYDQQHAGYMNAKWSLPYQIIFHFFVSKGHELFGNYEVGFAIFTLAQSIYVLYVIFRILGFLQQYMGTGWMVAGTVFFSINCPLMVLSMSSAQDAPFMAAFAMCILLLLEIAKNPDMFWKSKKKTAEVFAWMLMLFFWRNNGVFAMVFVLLAAVFGIRYYRKRLLCVLLAAVAIYELYSGPFLTTIGAEKSSTVTEMMSVPATQLAYVWNYDKNKLSQNEQNELFHYLPKDFLEKKNFIDDNRISDNFKANLNAKAIMSDPVRFAKFYCKLGMKFPKSFLIAHLDLTFGLWYPDIHYYDRKMYHPYIEYVSNSVEYVAQQNPRYITAQRYTRFPLLQHLLDYLFGPETLYGDSNWHMAFNESFLVSLIYKPGMYFWTFILLLLFTVIHKRWKMLLPVSMYAGLLLTIILGPVILFRYMAPIILSAPLLISTFVLKTDDNITISMQKDEYMVKRENQEKRKKDIFDRIMHLPGLRIFEPFYLKHKEVLLYLLFGGLSFVLNIVLFAWLARVIGLNALVANVIDWFACVLFQYITNKLWVFDGKTDNAAALLKQIASFFGGRVFTLVVEEAILAVFISLLHQNELAVKLIAQVVVIVLNYIISKKLVFAGAKN